MDIYEKYPYLKNRKNAKVIRIQIAPIGKASKHKDRSVCLTKEAAESIISEKKLLQMPIHYTKINSTDLPKMHKGLDNKYIEVGHILSEGEIVVDDGVEFLEADVILHCESQKEYVEEILANKEKLGNSWELIPSEGYENNNITNITKVEDFIGNGILDKNHTAFSGTRIVYASVDEVDNMEDRISSVIVYMSEKEVTLENLLTMLPREQLEEEFEKIKKQLNYENEIEEKYKSTLVENSNLKTQLEEKNQETYNLWDRLSIAQESISIYRDIISVYRGENNDLLMY